MRRHSVLLAAAVGLAASWLPGRPAQAQGEDRGDRERERGDRDRDGKRDHDGKDDDDGKRDRDGKRDHGKGDHDGKGDRDRDRDRDRDGKHGHDGDRDGNRDDHGRDGDRGDHGRDRDGRGPRAGDRPPVDPPGHYRARWDRSGWVMLGEQAVKGKRDRDVIMVGRREGRFTRLMLVVEDSDLEVQSMEVVFAGGERFNPRLRHFFREEDRTRPIDLPGQSRVIERIEFRYGNLPGGGAARVQVWAREGGGHVGRDDDRRPPPPPVADPRHRRAAPLVMDFWPRHGAVGTEVTIRGRRLTRDLRIQFGDQLVSASRVDDDMVTFVVPRARGRSMIVLSRPGLRDLPVGTFEVSGRDGRHERDRWNDQRRRAAERWWVERQRRLARSAAEREERMRAEEDRLARERENRRRHRRASLRARWKQQLLAREEVRAELSLHAERTARLDRMLRLAELEDEGRLVIRIRLLLDYEDARHAQRMGDLETVYARR